MNHFLSEQRLLAVKCAPGNLHSAPAEFVAIICRDAAEGNPEHADVSITARPFFESHGFCVAAQQEVKLGDVALRNFKMRKAIGP